MGKKTLSLPIQPFLKTFPWPYPTEGTSTIITVDFLTINSLTARLRLLIEGVHTVCADIAVHLHAREHNVLKVSLSRFKFSLVSFDTKKNTKQRDSHKKYLDRFHQQVSLPMALRKLTCGCLSYIRVQKKTQSLHVWNHHIFHYSLCRQKFAKQNAKIKLSNILKLIIIIIHIQKEKKRKEKKIIIIFCTWTEMKCESLKF